MSKSSLILLTGGRGRLASAIQDYQLSRNCQIQAFSRTAGDSYENIHDLLKPGFWEHADFLFHTAWSTVPLVSEREPAIEWEVDLPWLARMLRHFGERSTGQPLHFVFFSSGGTVYGDAAIGRSSKEGDILKPKGWYGQGKAQAEALVQEVCNYYNLPYTILRISNPYGMISKAMRPQGIIPILVNCALNETAFRMWGDGNAEKDFIHIDDFNAALNRVISERITVIFNLCSGSSFSVSSVISQIESITGREIEVINEPSYEWDVVASRLDSRAFCNIANWTPKVELREGLIKYIHSVKAIC